MMRWSNTPALASVPAERIVLLAGLGLVLPLLGDAAVYVVLATHTADAGILAADVGLMLAANRIIRIFLNGPLGVLIERLPRRTVLMGALLAGALSSFLYLFPGFWPLLAGRLLWGVAWIGLWLGGSTVVLDVASDANRGRLVGRYHAWFFVGVAFGSLFGGLLTDWLGYRATFAVAALLPLLLLVVWRLFLPETRPDSGSARSAPPLERKWRPAKTLLAQMGRLPAGAAAVTAWLRRAIAQPQAIRRAASGLARLPVHLPLVVAVAVMGLNWLIFIGVTGALLPLLLEERVGAAAMMFGAVIPLATFTGGLIAVNQGVGLAVSPAAGVISDRLRNRWGLVVLMLALGVAALGLTAVGGGLMVVIGTTLGAAASSVLQTQVITLIGDLSGANRQGRFLGLVNTAGDLGSAAGPLLAFRLLPLVGLKGVFLLAAGLLALVLPWALWAARRELRRELRRA